MGAASSRDLISRKNESRRKPVPPLNSNRSYLKKVFWPNLGVGSSFQVLDILEYACGLKLDSALILNQNPFFEMASNLAHWCCGLTSAGQTEV